MDASFDTAKPEQAITTSRLGNRLRTYVGGRRGLILLAVAALGVGLVLNWSWLVAVGVAPLLLALAPCAAMCALGLCMNKMGNKSCSTKSPDQPAPSGKSASAAPDRG